MKNKFTIFLLPPIEKITFYHPLFQFIAGIILKYAVGGTFFDFVGHFIIFLASLNLKTLIKKYLKKDLNTIFSLLIVGGSFLLMQILGIMLIENMLEIKPLLKLSNNEKKETQKYLLTFPGTSYSVPSKSTPDEIVNLILEKVAEETPSLSCEMKEDSTKYLITDKEAYGDVSKNIDLNGDGVEEVMVYLAVVCKNMIRGASGNGPFYVYQKRGDTWVNIGEMVGISLVVRYEKINNYYNIETNYHTSATSGITYSYEFRLADGNGSYQEVSKINYDNSTDAKK